MTLLQNLEKAWGCNLENAVTILCSTALASVIVKLVDAWLQRKARKDTLQDRQDKTEKLEAKVAENSKATTDIKEAVRLLIYDKFEYLASKRIDEGNITLKQKQIIKSFFDAYKRLEGDGWADDLMEMIDELPIKEDKK